MNPFNNCKTFPLSANAVAAFTGLKKSTEESVMVAATDEDISFEVETDTFEVAIAATLNQVGLFAQELSEAQAIIQSICHWKHYLTGNHFTLKNDQ